MYEKIYGSKGRKEKEQRKNNIKLKDRHGDYSMGNSSSNNNRNYE